jgi:hypothetical protein
MAYAFVDVTFGSLTTALGLIVIIAGMGGYFWFNWRTSGDKAKDETIDTWKGLAESRAARNAELEAENKELSSRLDACEKLRNEITRFNLRLQARETQYQHSINRLEVELKLKPTNFDVALTDREII